MGRFGFMGSGIQARSGLGLCGLAVTGTPSRRQPHGSRRKSAARRHRGRQPAVNITSAVFGELMPHRVAAKLGGLVVDGAIRDVEGIASPASLQ